DGGSTPKTIATARGICADALFAGTLWLTNDLNIEGQTGYLNITGERFVMRSKSDANKYFEITPNGALANHGFFSVTRPDAYTDSSGKNWGRWIQDGISNGQMDIQRNMFMYPNIIGHNGQRYTLSESLATSGTTYVCEDIRPSHDFKFITIGVGMNVISGTFSTNAIVEVVDMNTGGVVATVSRFVRAGDGTVWENLTFEL